MTSPETILVDSGPLLEATGLVHRVLEPSGPGPYRTAVMPHGRFGDEDAMWLFRRTMPTGWLKSPPAPSRPTRAAAIPGRYTKMTPGPTCPPSATPSPP